MKTKLLYLFILLITFSTTSLKAQNSETLEKAESCPGSGCPICPANNDICLMEYRIKETLEKLEDYQSKNEPNARISCCPGPCCPDPAILPEFDNEMTAEEAWQVLEEYKKKNKLKDEFEL